MNSQDKQFDYLTIGHFHNPATVDGARGEKIINGAWAGGSFFSLKVLQTASRPSQYFFGVTPKHGISWRYKVYLDEPMSAG